MRFRLAVTALSAALVLSGCGGGVASNPSPVPDSLNAPQGVTKDQILIGSSIDITGPLPVGGAALEHGLQLAVAVINAKGGINGRKITVKILDDQFSAPIQLQNVKQLINDDKVYALLDLPGSANVPASWPTIQAAGIPFIGADLPPDPKLPSVFMIGASLVDQGQVLVPFLHEKGVKKIGVLRTNDQLGTSGLQGVTNALKAYPDMQVVSDQAMAGSDNNVSAYVLNLKQANPDAVLLLGTVNQAFLAIKQASDLNWHPIFAGNSSSMGSANLLTLPGAEGAYATQFSPPLNSTTPAVKQFKADLQQYHPDFVANASVLTLDDYGWAMVFFEILKRCGNDLSWANFIKTAESLKNYETGFFSSITFGPLPDGHSSGRGSVITQLVSGQWELVHDFILPPS